MSKTILCADDSATMQTVAQITFKAGDFEYVGARSADEALEKAKAQKPDLILADAVMPGKTGYELCKAVKSDPGLADVPVIVMCGNSQAYDQDKGKEAGADGHVTKPWDTQQMLDKIAGFLEAGATSKPAAAASPAAAAKPEPVPAKPEPVPAKPAAAAPSKPPATPPSTPAPPRSATLMGMPTIKMPPGGREKPEGVTSITPPSIAAKEKAAPPAAPPAETAPAPVAEKVAEKPAAERAPAKPAAAAGANGPSRAPMIGATPSRRPALAKANAERQAVETVATVAREVGLDPRGPEMEVLIKLSSQVVERIVWEVVPELAETIIRENLDKLTAGTR